jgi:hypothetical protein
VPFLIFTLYRGGWRGGGSELLLRRLVARQHAERVLGDEVYFAHGRAANYVQLARGRGRVSALLGQVEFTRGSGLSRLQRICALPRPFLLVELTLHLVCDLFFCLEPAIACGHVEHKRQSAGLGPPLCRDLLAVPVLVLRALHIAVQLHHRPHVVLYALCLHLVGNVVLDGTAHQPPRARLLVNRLTHEPPKFLLLLVIGEGATQRAARPVRVAVTQFHFRLAHFVVVFAPLVSS